MCGVWAYVSVLECAFEMWLCKVTTCDNLFYLCTCTYAAHAQTHAHTQDLGKLCNMMSHMPACSIRMACTQATPAVVGDYCKPWSLLSGICSTSHGEMMAGMGGCEKYKQLCVANTVVVGCETQIPKLVTTKEVVDDTFAACADTPKPAQCSTCVAASASLIGSSACANPLPVLSDACQAKSSATYCSNLKDMCNAADAAISNSALFCAGVTGGASRAHFSALTLLVAAAVALFV